MNEEIFNLLSENGFVINKSTDFIRAIEGQNVTDIIQNLIQLEKRANSPFDVLSFSKSFMESVEKLDDIVKNDNFAGLSDKANINRYHELVASLKSKFNFVAEYIAAEKNYKHHEDEYFKIKNELNRIDFRKDLSGAMKTRETLRLMEAKDIYEKTYLEAVNYFNKQKENYNTTMQNFDLNAFKNPLLQEINELGTVLRSLALNSENKSAVESLISEMRNSIAYYGLDKVKSKTEFDDLCKKYSLLFVGRDKSMLNEEELHQNDKDESFSETVSNTHSVFSPSKVELKEVTKKEQVKETVLTKTKDGELNWLVNELKRLNPDATFELKKATDYKYDALINCDKELNTLRLPNGYYYTSTSITNRFSAEENVLNVEFVTIKKEKTKSQVIEDQPVVEDTLSVVDVPVPPVIESSESLEEKKELIKASPQQDIFEEISRNVNKKIEEELEEERVDAPEVVEERAKEEQHDAPEATEEPTKEEKHDAPVVTEEPTKEDGKIPSGKKLKVTKTRRAILSPTVKKVLVGGGLASVAASFLGPVFLTAGVIGTITAASVAAIGDILRDENYYNPTLDKNNIPKNASELKAFGQNIVDSFKRKMSKKSQEQSVDNLDDLDRQVSEIVSRGR